MPKVNMKTPLSPSKIFSWLRVSLAPVVIELEDGHWIDSDSLALLETLTHNVADYPIFMLSTLRYNDDGSKTTFQLEGVRETQID